MHAFKHLLIWVVLPLSALALLVACAPTATLNALVAGDTHTRSVGVSYGTLARQQLDIYRPTRAAPPAGWPMVLFFYGGSWNSGERASYKFVAEALAARGVLTLVADYRLYPEVRYPEFLRDCALALAFGLNEAARLGADPKRVFVMGHSAGAYNAAMLALDPRWLAATGHTPADVAGWIGLAGPYDFLPMTNVAAQPVFFHPNYPEGTQPIAYASRSAPRTFLGAAVNDTLVNPQRSTVGLATRLQAAGATVTLKLYERVGHTTLAAAFARPLRWLAPVLEDVMAFIEAGAPNP